MFVNIWMGRADWQLTRKKEKENINLFRSLLLLRFFFLNIQKTSNNINLSILRFFFPTKKVKSIFFIKKKKKNLAKSELNFLIRFDI